MRALPLLAVLSAVAADHSHLRKQPCDKDCQIKKAQSKVDEVEEALDKNLAATQGNKKMVAYTKSIKGNADIAKQEKAVGVETQATALGKMLGSMWREMREYQSPVYEEKLSAQSSKLADESAKLRSKLALARGALDHATSLDEKTAEDEEAPPTKLAIRKAHHKSLEMHSKEEDDEKDDDDDDDDEDDEKHAATESTKKDDAKEVAEGGEEDATKVAEEVEQEVDDPEVKKKAPAHKVWTNNGLAKGMEATADQHKQFWNHGFSAGDPDRKGLYPVDLSAPIAETPFTPKEIFGKKKVVKTESVKGGRKVVEDEQEAKVTAEPVEAEEDEDEEADAVKRVEAATQEADEEEGDDDEDEEAPKKAAAGTGDMGDGMSATHAQFKKFISGGFATGDVRKGLYPVDLAK